MIRQVLTPSERRDWLRLARTTSVGPCIFYQLLRRFGSVQAALEMLPHLAQRGGNQDFKTPSLGKCDDEIAAAEKIGAKIITWGEPGYPEILSMIEDAPPVITIRGNAALLHKHSIGIVGARNGSLGGRKIAETLARELGAQNIVITSGLARGIDSAAHKASLSSGTVAVVAGGADFIYPPENKSLYDKIIESGCVLSEVPLGTEPSFKLCCRRNRIISGLSLGVVVIEAALESGSLVTAKTALDQRRAIFAVPGSPLDPRCSGTNDLIRQGAVLTEKAEDILQEILHNAYKPQGDSAANDFYGIPPPTDEIVLGSARTEVLKTLAEAPLSIDELVRRSKIAASVILTILLELELAGHVERQAGNKVTLIA